MALVLLLLSSSAAAQRDPSCSPTGSSAELAEQALVRAGFEEVYVCVRDGEAVVHYEDRLYRYAVAGMRVVRAAVEPYLGGGAVTVALVPHRLGVPLGTYRFPRRQEAIEGAVEARLDVAPRPTPGPALNPSRYKLDAVLHPEFEAAFGNFDRPVRARLSLAPALTTSLWRGMQLTGQVVFTVLNDVDDRDVIRPGILAASQTVRLPYATFATVAAGYFTGNRYGLDAVVQGYALGGRVRATARAGRTGYAALQGGTWYYGPLDVTTAQVSLGVVALPQYALTAEVGYGRYLFGDDALTFGLHRRFGEVQMGFTGIVAGDDLNLEARVVLPLPLARHARPKRVRFRVADRFPWAYRYRRLTPIAADYATAPGAPELFGPLNPAYFRYLLAREIEAERAGFERVRAGAGR